MRNELEQICKKIKAKKLRADYFDNRLSRDEKKEVDKHLESCKGCKRCYTSSDERAVYLGSRIA
ncbi:MAG: zf-HC2 domain-containing protein [archaeon]